MKKAFGKGMAIPFPAGRGSGGEENRCLKKHERGGESAGPRQAGWAGSSRRRTRPVARGRRPIGGWRGETQAATGRRQVVGVEVVLGF